MLIACAACALASCSERSPEAAPAPVVDAAAHTYTSRGVITALPSPDGIRGDFRIQHEHIPDFRGKDGSIHMNPDGVPGMKAMDMPFPSLGPGVTLEGLEVGHKVEFDLLVAYHPRLTYSLTRLVRLPDETELDFANKPTP